MDSKTAMLYAQLKPYKALVEKTKGFIRWALDKVDKPYVACSFGKDSAVMLHLVREIRPNIKVRFIRWEGETEHIDNYDEVISQWGDINLEQIEMCRISLSDKRKDRYDVGKEYDAFFVGLRMQESTARRITLKTHGLFYKNKAGLVRISPLAEWTDKDVATYVFANSLPMLNSYKINGMKSRTASRIPREDFGIREQFLSDLKARDFTAYQKLLLKFPEISN